MLSTNSIMETTFKTADIRLSARQKRREEAHFAKVRNAETSYIIQIRKIARQVGDLIRHYDPFTPQVIGELQEILYRYSQIIRPWAASTAARMIAEVARRDETAWARHGKDIGRSLRAEIASADLGDEVKRILKEQVHLIQGIPIEAGNKIQEYAREAVITGKRFKSITSDIQDTVAGMTWNRATLIGRTEVAKASSAIVQVRAQHIGSESYIWESVRDRDVRRMHKLLHGTPQRWDSPPIAEEQGQRHHPGEFPNCRCFANPIIPR